MDLPKNTTYSTSGTGIKIPENLPVSMQNQMKDLILRRQTFVKPQESTVSAPQQTLTELSGGTVTPAPVSGPQSFSTGYRLPDLQYDPARASALASLQQNISSLPGGVLPTGVSAAPATGRGISPMPSDYSGFRNATLNPLDTAVYPVQPGLQNLGGGQVVVDQSNPNALIKSTRGINTDISKIILGDRSPWMYQVDHIEPLWAGGADTISNLNAYSNPEHELKTRVQAVPYTLLINGFWGDPNTTDAKKKALQMANNWKLNDESIVPTPDDSGLLDFKTAKEIAAEWDAPPEWKMPTLREAWEAVPDYLRTAGKGTIPEPIRAAAQGYLSQASFGAIPNVLDEDAPFIERAANIVGGIGGMMSAFGALSVPGKILGSIKGVLNAGKTAEAIKGAITMTEEYKMANAEFKAFLEEGVKFAKPVKDFAPVTNLNNPYKWHDLIDISKLGLEEIGGKITATKGISGIIGSHAGKEAGKFVVFGAASDFLQRHYSPDVMSGKVEESYPTSKEIFLGTVESMLMGASFGAIPANIRSTFTVATATGVMALMGDPEHPYDAIVSGGTFGLLHLMGVSQGKDAHLSMGKEATRLAGIGSYNRIRDLVPTLPEIKNPKEGVTIDEFINMYDAAAKAEINLEHLYRFPQEITRLNKESKKIITAEPPKTEDEYNAQLGAIHIAKAWAELNISAAVKKKAAPKLWETGTPKVELPADLSKQSQADLSDANFFALMSRYAKEYHESAPVEGPKWEASTAGQAASSRPEYFREPYGDPKNKLSKVAVDLTLLDKTAFSQKTAQKVKLAISNNLGESAEGQANKKLMENSHDEIKVQRRSRKVLIIRDRTNTSDPYALHIRTLRLGKDKAPTGVSDHFGFISRKDPLQRELAAAMDALGMDSIVGELDVNSLRLPKSTKESGQNIASLFVHALDSFRHGEVIRQQRLLIDQDRMTQATLEGQQSPEQRKSVKKLLQDVDSSPASKKEEAIDRFVATIQPIASAADVTPRPAGYLSGRSTDMTLMYNRVKMVLEWGKEILSQPDATSAATTFAKYFRGAKVDAAVFEDMIARKNEYTVDDYFDVIEKAGGPVARLFDIDDAYKYIDQVGHANLGNHLSKTFTDVFPRLRVLGGEKPSVEREVEQPKKVALAGQTVLPAVETPTKKPSIMDRFKKEPEVVKTETPATPEGVAVQTGTQKAPSIEERAKKERMKKEIERLRQSEEEVDDIFFSMAKDVSPEGVDAGIVAEAIKELAKEQGIDHVKVLVERAEEIKRTKGEEASEDYIWNQIGKNGLIKSQIRFGKEGRDITIVLTKHADFSSVVHEMGHIARVKVFNRELPASERFNITDKDLDAVEKFCGVGENKKWTPEAEEVFAVALERFLREGKTPVIEGRPEQTERVARVMKKVANFLKEVYSSIKDTLLGKKITKEVRTAFDHLMSRGDGPIERPRQPEKIPKHPKPTQGLEAEIAEKRTKIQRKRQNAEAFGKAVKSDPVMMRKWTLKNVVYGTPRDPSLELKGEHEVLAKKREQGFKATLDMAADADGIVAFGANGGVTDKLRKDIKAENKNIGNINLNPNKFEAGKKYIFLSDPRDLRRQSLENNNELRERLEAAIDAGAFIVIHSNEVLKPTGTANTYLIGDVEIRNHLVRYSKEKGGYLPVVDSNNPDFAIWKPRALVEGATDASLESTRQGVSEMGAQVEGGTLSKKEMEDSHITAETPIVRSEETPEEQQHIATLLRLKTESKDFKNELNDETNTVKVPSRYATMPDWEIALDQKRKARTVEEQERADDLIKYTVANLRDMKSTEFGGPHRINLWIQAMRGPKKTPKEKFSREAMSARVIELRGENTLDNRMKALSAFAKEIQKDILDSYPETQRGEISKVLFSKESDWREQTARLFGTLQKKPLKVLKFGSPTGEFGSKHEFYIGEGGLEQDVRANRDIARRLKELGIDTEENPIEKPVEITYIEKPAADRLKLVVRKSSNQVSELNKILAEKDMMIIGAAGNGLDNLVAVNIIPEVITYFDKVVKTNPERYFTKQEIAAKVPEAIEGFENPYRDQFKFARVLYRDLFAFGTVEPEVTPSYKTSSRMNLTAETYDDPTPWVVPDALRNGIPVQYVKAKTVGTWLDSVKQKFDIGIYKGGRSTDPEIKKIREKQEKNFRDIENDDGAIYAGENLMTAILEWHHLRGSKNSSQAKPIISVYFPGKTPEEVSQALVKGHIKLMTADGADAKRMAKENPGWSYNSWGLTIPNTTVKAGKAIFEKNSKTRIPIDSIRLKNVGIGKEGRVTGGVRSKLQETDAGPGKSVSALEVERTRKVGQYGYEMEKSITEARTSSDFLLELAKRGLKITDILPPEKRARVSLGYAGRSALHEVKAFMKGFSVNHILNHSVKNAGMFYITEGTATGHFDGLGKPARAINRGEIVTNEEGRKRLNAVIGQEVIAWRDPVEFPEEFLILKVLDGESAGYNHLKGEMVALHPEDMREVMSADIDGDQTHIATVAKDYSVPAPKNPGEIPFPVNREELPPYYKTLATRGKKDGRIPVLEVTPARKEAITPASLEKDQQDKIEGGTTLSTTAQHLRAVESLENMGAGFRLSESKKNPGTYRLSDFGTNKDGVEVPLFGKPITIYGEPGIPDMILKVSRGDDQTIKGRGLHQASVDNKGSTSFKDLSNGDSNHIYLTMVEEIGTNYLKKGEISESNQAWLAGHLKKRTEALQGIFDVAKNLETRNFASLGEIFRSKKPEGWEVNKVYTGIKLVKKWKKANFALTPYLEQMIEASMVPEYFPQGVSKSEISRDRLSSWKINVAIAKNDQIPAHDAAVNYVKNNLQLYTSKDVLADPDIKTLDNFVFNEKTEFFREKNENAVFALERIEERRELIKEAKAEAEETGKEFDPGEYPPEKYELHDAELHFKAVQSHIFDTFIPELTKKYENDPVTLNKKLRLLSAWALESPHANWGWTVRVEGSRRVKRLEDGKHIITPKYQGKTKTFGKKPHYLRLFDNVIDIDPELAAAYLTTYNAWTPGWVPGDPLNVFRNSVPERTAPQKRSNEIEEMEEYDISVEDIFEEENLGPEIESPSEIDLPEEPPTGGGGRNPKFDPTRYYGQGGPGWKNIKTAMIKGKAEKVIKKNTDVRFVDLPKKEYSEFVEKKGKDLINFNKNNTNTADKYHEKVHAWVANSKDFKKLKNEFQADWDKLKSRNSVLKSIDQNLEKDKKNYPQKNGFPEERYAYLVERKGGKGLSGIPPTLQKYYKDLLNP